MTVRKGPELTIIIPTFNECDNVEELILKLSIVLRDINYEVIFVDDDSPDKTYLKLREISINNPNIRFIHRIGRRGLSSACVEGMLSTSAPFFLIMDADMQHDESIIVKMYNFVKNHNYDVAIGSRYIDTGKILNWNKDRIIMSELATKLSSFIFKQKIKDPLSGFFMLKREVFDNSFRKLSNIGFKILLDILTVQNTELKIIEVPYTFKARKFGESKLDNVIIWQFVILLIDKKFGKWMSLNFIQFSIVGFFGLFIHLGTLYLLHSTSTISFINAQIISTFIAITFNYVANNSLTYSNLKLRGLNFLKGWVLFNCICGFGALANFALSDYLYELHSFAQVNWLMPAVAGILIASVWNYSTSTFFIWELLNKKNTTISSVD
jgi:dolichol-phosphate mannosyltransferase